VQFSTTVGTDRIQGFANDVNGKVVCVFPGKNPYIVKFLNSYSSIDVESASEEISSLFF
jgi:hypothetical protein